MNKNKTPAQSNSLFYNINSVKRNKNTIQKRWAEKLIFWKSKKQFSTVKKGAAKKKKKKKDAHKQKHVCAHLIKMSAKVREFVCLSFSSAPNAHRMRKPCHDCSSVSTKSGFEQLTYIHCTTICQNYSFYKKWSAQRHSKLQCTLLNQLTANISIMFPSD